MQPMNKFEKNNSNTTQKKLFRALNSLVIERQMPAVSGKKFYACCSVQ
jgi:hypothetical protein